MNSRNIELEDVGTVVLKKSKRAKNILFKISSSGIPTVTIPYYVPYYIAEKTVRSHRKWFHSRISTVSKTLFESGKKIGKDHILQFVQTSKDRLSSRVTNRDILVSLPSSTDWNDSSAQHEAQKASIRGLRRQAENYLPSLLHKLALQHGYTYREVRIKKMTSRWGSCSSNRIINLNLWLMQLPDDLITYVCCHELVHLHHPHHQASFWEELSNMIPDYKTLRHRMKAYKTTLV